MGPPQKSLGLAEWEQGHGGCAKEGREPHRSLQLCVTVCEWEHELLVLESIPRISLAYWGTHAVCRWERAELFS